MKNRITSLAVHPAEGTTPIGGMTLKSRKSAVSQPNRNFLFGLEFVNRIHPYRRFTTE
jgi:hypothetical protein